MSEIKVNKLSPSTGTVLTLGDNGDTFSLPSGVTLTNNGTSTGFGSDGVIKYFGTASLSADPSITGPSVATDATYQDTGATITIPAADVVGLTKIIIFTQGSIQIEKGSGSGSHHSHCAVRLQRTAPSSVIYQKSTIGEVTPVAECYVEAGQLQIDSSLGTGDHTYSMFYSRLSQAYSGPIHYRQDGWKLIAVGI
jgi:hypothetical protein